MDDQPRCHLCRSDEHIARGSGDPSLWWCVDVAGCNYRARLRLHMRRSEAKRLLEIECPGAAAVMKKKPPRRDLSATTTNIRTLVRLLRQDPMASRKAAEEVLGREIPWGDWKVAHIAYYKSIGRRDLAWIARQ